MTRAVLLLSALLAAAPAAADGVPRAPRSLDLGERVYRTPWTGEIPADLSVAQRRRADMQIVVDPRDRRERTAEAGTEERRPPRRWSRFR
jgi:hypothetical protein